MKEKLKPDNGALVFVVEDNAAYRILMGRILERNGFTVMLFESGLEALDVLEHVKPDLVLSDIQMPDMDGFRFQKEVRKRFQSCKIPFVYISSSTSRSVIKKANRIGAAKMLGKPVTPGMLDQSIRQVLSA